MKKDFQTKKRKVIYIYFINTHELHVFFFFLGTTQDNNIIVLSNTLSSLKISKKVAKTKINNRTKNKIIIKGPLDGFLNERKCKEDSMTLSDFECDETITTEPGTTQENNLIDLTNTLCSLKLSKKVVKTKMNNVTKAKVTIKGPLDKFLNERKSKEDSLTLSDFECDGNDLNLSDIVNEIIAEN